LLQATNDASSGCSDVNDNTTTDFNIFSYNDDN